mgnify:CR=1 FL=1
MAFFATSHGKSACGGIGGTVKRQAARKSLQATTNGHILTPLDLYTWAREDIKGIDFLFCSMEEVKSHTKALEERFGSRANHGWCYMCRLVSIGTLKVCHMSGDDWFFIGPKKNVFPVSVLLYFFPPYL